MPWVRCRGALGPVPRYDPAVSAVLPSPLPMLNTRRLRREAAADAGGERGCGAGVYGAAGAATPRPAARAGKGPPRSRLRRAPGRPGAAEVLRAAAVPAARAGGLRPAASCPPRPAWPPPRGLGGMNFASGLVPAGSQPALGAHGLRSGCVCERSAQLSASRPRVRA